MSKPAPRQQLAAYLDQLADLIPPPSKTYGGKDLHKAAMREAAVALRSADTLIALLSQCLEPPDTHLSTGRE